MASRLNSIPQLVLQLLLLLTAFTVAAPTQQHPLKPHRNPYAPDFKDPYDHKVDSIGRKVRPEPVQGPGRGTSVLGPRNRWREMENPDLIRPPSTDHGDMKNMRWSMADSHIRIEENGWTRQTTARELGTSIEIAGVNMRLDEGVIRELHWHSAAEWAYVIAGNVRITVMDPDGGSYIDDLSVGDLWYFPAGYPHSLQGLGPNGTEFLLIFDDGNFSEEETFLLTDWLAHTSKAVLAQNFRLAPEDLKDLPDGSDRYIFQASSPGTIKDEKPPGFKQSKQRFSHRMLAQEPLNATGGQVRITDSRNFPISTTISAAHLSLEPGALRELHWHSLADEWAFFLSGRARVTVFGSQGTARTFDYTAGDVGIVPRNNGHFIENLSDDEPLEVLEIFRSSEFQDFSLYQWMGTTPQRNVRDHLFPDDEEAGGKFVESVEDAKKDPIRAPAKAQKGGHAAL